MVKKTVYRREKKPNKPKIHNQSEESTIKYIRNLLKLKMENKAIRDDYYKPIRVSNFWNDNYIEYESNGDTKKNLSVKDHQQSGTWKVQLAIATNFISSKDPYEEKGIHLRSDSIEFMTVDNANYVVDELFESLFSR